MNTEKRLQRAKSVALLAPGKDPGGRAVALVAGDRRQSYLLSGRRVLPPKVRRRLRRRFYIVVLAAVRMTALATRAPLHQYEKVLLRSLYHSVPALASYKEIGDLLSSAGLSVSTPDLRVYLDNTYTLFRVDYAPRYKDSTPLDLRRFNVLAMQLKKKFIREANVDDSHIAFVALGGQDDLSGDISTEELRRVCKTFALTIDIDAFIAEADEDGSGLLDFDEFKAMFRDDDSPPRAEGQGEPAHGGSPVIGVPGGLGFPVALGAAANASAGRTGQSVALDGAAALQGDGDDAMGGGGAGGGGAQTGGGGGATGGGGSGGGLGTGGGGGNAATGGGGGGVDASPNAVFESIEHWAEHPAVPPPRRRRVKVPALEAYRARPDATERLPLWRTGKEEDARKARQETPRIAQASSSFGGARRFDGDMTVQPLPAPKGDPSPKPRRPNMKDGYLDAPSMVARARAMNERRQQRRRQHERLARMEQDQREQRWLAASGSAARSPQSARAYDGGERDAAADAGSPATARGAGAGGSSAQSGAAAGGGGDGKVLPAVLVPHRPPRGAAQSGRWHAYNPFESADVGEDDFEARPAAAAGSPHTAGTPDGHRLPPIAKAKRQRPAAVHTPEETGSAQPTPAPTNRNAESDAATTATAATPSTAATRTNQNASAPPATAAAVEHSGANSRRASRHSSGRSSTSSRRRSSVNTAPVEADANTSSAIVRDAEPLEEPSAAQPEPPRTPLEPVPAVPAAAAAAEGTERDEAPADTNVGDPAAPAQEGASPPPVEESGTGAATAGEEPTETGTSSELPTDPPQEAEATETPAEPPTEVPTTEAPNEAPTEAPTGTATTETTVEAPTAPVTEAPPEMPPPASAPASEDPDWL